MTPAGSLRFFRSILSSLRLRLTRQSLTTITRVSRESTSVTSTIGTPIQRTRGQTQPNLNDQIAFLYYGDRDVNATSFLYYLNISSVDADTFNVTNPPNSNISLGIDVQTYSIDQVTLAATDLQGRSQLLGEPTKVSLTSSFQPIAIIAVPPVHIDFMSPDPLSGASSVW